MKPNKKIRSGFLLAALGMVYGDIATSPLYVMKFIVMESGGAPAVSEALVLGSLSLILWSLLLLATVKGVALLLRADNRGEGGLFALYALVRDRGRWLLVPAALGGAALLADSVLTPALTLTAAVEGSRSLSAGSFTGPGTRGAVILVLLLLSALFLFQGLGSRRTGRFLGPVMLVWLLFIGAAGAAQLSGGGAAVLRAFDPRLGVRFLFSAGNPMGFALLGLVFLSVTGTEILYANLDFGGRKAITRAWPFVLLCLCLSYLGQGAWLIGRLGDPAWIGNAADPFFQMLPFSLRIPALLLALAAAWTASQTVINGSFTLVSEAIRLNLLPPLEIRYPSDSIRQEYIPSVNLLMWLFSCAAVAVFRSGQRMASVYGLTIAVAMLTTSVMLFVHLRGKRPGAWPLHGLVAVFGALELCYLAASLEKLLTGGVVTLLLTLLLLAAMLAWDRGEEIESRFGARLPLRGYLPQLKELSSDADFVKLADNLVYIDRGRDTETVDQAILYSILDRGPKRAQAYWFVTVNTVSDPYRQEYRVETFDTDYVFRIRLDLGYKCSRPLTRYLRDVFLDMEKQGLVPISRKSYCISEESALGTFHYCILRRRASGAEEFTTLELWAVRMRNLLQELAGLRTEWYTEEDTNVEVERIPMSLAEESPQERLQRLFGAPEPFDPSDEEE
ncbi:MAG: KUP/HAK/KT family potassium transporter [Oscillospiraceae bacterium]|nr:KUP/HAK/KT family potassium transporter [Oscillospiraceae bacterium]